jgi:hypothetical protein
MRASRRAFLILATGILHGTGLPGSAAAGAGFDAGAYRLSAQQGPSIADCNAVYGYFRANEGFVVEYDGVAPLLDSLLNGGYAEHDLLVGYGERFNDLAELHAGMSPPWQLQDFHRNVIGLYYNAGGAFQNFDIAIHGGFMTRILGPDEASGRAAAAGNARSFTYEAARLRGSIATTATSWQNACAVYNR